MTNLTLSGFYVNQGNTNGFTISEENEVLHTSDLSSCVAVCGHNGGISFMIHSDSLARGVSRASLMHGIQKVAPIGDGTGWSISLIGGSTASTSKYLKSKIPGAVIQDFGESEGAYITQSGVIARSKRELAQALGVTSVSITPHNAAGADVSTVASPSEPQKNQSTKPSLLERGALRERGLDATGPDVTRRNDRDPVEYYSSTRAKWEAAGDRHTGGSGRRRGSGAEPMAPAPLRAGYEPDAPQRRRRDLPASGVMPTGERRPVSYGPGNVGDAWPAAGRTRGPEPSVAQPPRQFVPVDFRHRPSSAQAVGGHGTGAEGFNAQDDLRAYTASLHNGARGPGHPSAGGEDIPLPGRGVPGRHSWTPGPGPLARSSERGHHGRHGSSREPFTARNADVPLPGSLPGLETRTGRSARNTPDLGHRSAVEDPPRRHYTPATRERPHSRAAAAEFRSSRPVDPPPFRSSSAFTGRSYPHEDLRRPPTAGRDGNDYLDHLTTALGGVDLGREHRTRPHDRTSTARHEERATLPRSLIAEAAARSTSRRQAEDRSGERGQFPPTYTGMTTRPPSPRFG